MSLSAFYYAFIIPVGVIILANIIIFIMILKNLWGRSKGLQSNQSEKKRAMMNLRASLTVLVLLGKNKCNLYYIVLCNYEKGEKN